LITAHRGSRRRFSSVQGERIACSTLACRLHESGSGITPDPRLFEASMAAYSKILVPVDFSEHSMEAIKQAREIAGRFNAELHLITVVDPGPPATTAAELYPVYRDYLRQEQAQAMSRLNELAASIAGSTPVQHFLRTGHVQQEIVKYIEENSIDLVVLGTHGRTGLSHWFMGSVAEKVARFAPCAVLIARPKGMGSAAMKNSAT
jgi:nucleotide-binding universal stress UspA family protein